MPLTVKPSDFRKTLFTDEHMPFFFGFLTSEEMVFIAQTMEIMENQNEDQFSCFGGILDYTILSLVEKGIIEEGDNSSINCPNLYFSRFFLYLSETRLG